jgi:D-aspartate ligase
MNAAIPVRHVSEPRVRRGVRARPLACVMGDTDLVRPLGLAGIPSAVVAPPGDPARFSRFTRTVVPWFDPWERAEEQVDALVRFGRSQDEAPVLFYEGDADLLMVSRYRQRLGQAFRFVVPEATLVEALVDKGRFQALAARLNLPVPASREVEPSLGGAPEDLGLSFPVVVKPLTRRASEWRPIAGGVKAQQVDSLEVLRALWRRLAAARLRVLIQELVPGPEAAIESYHVYVDPQGETVGEFTGRKLRTFPARHGYSCAVIITEASDVAALGREVVRRLALHGVAKCDFKRSPDGRLSLLEVNPRFNLWHHPGARAGVNLPALVYGDLIGLPRPVAPRARPGVRWCNVWHDSAASRASGMSFAKWLPWAIGCETKRVVAWDDPLPIVCGGLWRFWRRRGPSGRAP